jgi:hypothetical protein
VRSTGERRYVPLGEAVSACRALLVEEGAKK